MGTWLWKNRSGLMVATSVTHATGTAGREAATTMIADMPGITLGADKAYDTKGSVAGMPRLGVTPHVTRNNKRRRSAIDGRATRHMKTA